MLDEAIKQAYGEARRRKVDGDKEFESQYVDHLLTRYLCQKTVRPPAQPRFGFVIERLFGTAHSTFLHNLLGNTQASKVPRMVTREVDPRRLAVWTLGDLYTFLCEWAYEVYDQIEHPALDQTPRAMFVNGLAKGGGRRNRGIAYDDLFIKETMPTSRAEKGKIQSRVVMDPRPSFPCMSSSDPWFSQTGHSLTHDMRNEITASEQ